MVKEPKMSIETVLTSRTYENENALEDTLYDAERFARLLLTYAQSHLGFDTIEDQTVRKQDAHMAIWLMYETQEHIEKALKLYDGCRRYRAPDEPNSGELRKSVDDSLDHP